jgi:hypothetical protein
VVTGAVIEIDNDVILDGEGNLTIDGNESHTVFSVPVGVTAELRGFAVTRGGFVPGIGLAPTIQNQGTLTLTDSTISENIGGITNESTLTMTNSTMSNNGFGVRSDGTLTVTDSTVSRNPGGIGNRGNMTITRSTVSENDGVGIENEGTATVTDSTVSRNDTRLEGGGILNEGTLTLTNSTVSENHAETGGGIYNQGTLTLSNSTVSGNAAFGDGGGAGVFNDGTLMLTNSTVSGNEGDGIHSIGGTLTLTNSTVSSRIRANTGFNPERAPSFVSIATTASLIDGVCTQEGEDDDVSWTSNGYNIESPGDTCGFNQTTDQVNTSAEALNLGELADNGGPTMTHALLTVPAMSVAIDAIPADSCGVDTDQRGEPRPELEGSMCDVGSFELQQSDVQPLGGGGRCSASRQEAQVAWFLGVLMLIGIRRASIWRRMGAGR